eukprot:1650407-Amphidinium_carterae.1
MVNKFCGLMLLFYEEVWTSLKAKEGQTKIIKAKHWHIGIKASEALSVEPKSEGPAMCYPSTTASWSSLFFDSKPSASFRLVSSDNHSQATIYLKSAHMMVCVASLTCITSCSQAPPLMSVALTIPSSRADAIRTNTSCRKAQYHQRAKSMRCINIKAKMKPSETYWEPQTAGSSFHHTSIIRLDFAFIQ